jgi:hypothetical protein
MPGVAFFLVIRVNLQRIQFYKFLNDLKKTEIFNPSNFRN